MPTELSVQLYPRHKKGSVASAGATRQAGMPLVLTKQVIVTLFPLSQTDAAARLGVSITSLKKVCRKMGIARWPFSRRLGLEKSLSWNVRNAEHYDSEAVTTTSDYELASCSDYSTICASKLQEMTKPRAEAYETTSNSTLALPPPWAKWVNMNGDSGDGSSLADYGDIVQNIDTDLLHFHPSTTQSHFPGCVPASLTAEATSASRFPESCRKLFVKAGDVDDDLRRDSSLFPCQPARDYMEESSLGPRFDQPNPSQIEQCTGKCRALPECLIIAEIDGERQTATAMEDSSDDLSWLVYPKP